MNENYNMENNQVNSPNTTQEQDCKSFGMSVLGFLFPVVGLILYIVWQSTMPLKAKSAGKGALASVILCAVLSFIAIAISIVGGFYVAQHL